MAEREFDFKQMRVGKPFNIKGLPMLRRLREWVKRQGFMNPWRLLHWSNFRYFGLFGGPEPISESRLLGAQSIFTRLAIASAVSDRHLQGRNVAFQTKKAGIEPGFF